MHNDIITQNVKLIDKKMIINETKIEIIKSTKYLVYYVSREFEPVVCEKCGVLVHKVKDYRQRIVKTFINYDYPVLIKYKQRRLICDCGKTLLEHNSIVSKGCRISNYLKLEIIKQCQYKHSFTTIAKELNVNRTTVINTFMDNFNFDRKELSEVICVDEFSANINQENKYACIIGNPINKEIIDILPSRHQYYLEDYLSKIPQNERLKVKIVNIDMWEAYKVVFSNYCWNASIAVDPFHWVKHATDNFHKLRRIVEEQTYNPKVKNILRSDWKLFSLKEESLSEKRYYSKLLNRYISSREKVEYCINSDSRLEQAWSILQEIYKFRDKCTLEQAENELIKIIEKLEQTKINEMISIAKTYRHWYTEICNSFMTCGPYNKRTSNAFIEGKNRLCKEIKAFSCGFNNFEIYRARILFISSNGNIPFKKSDNKRKLYQKSKRKGG
jgi:transposase